MGETESRYIDHLETDRDRRVLRFRERGGTDVLGTRVAPGTRR